MKIYYSIVDPYPAYRVDLSELFGSELARKGLCVEWYMAQGGGGRASDDKYHGQAVNLPFGRWIKSKILGRLSYWISDAWFIFIILFRNFDAIQCRDKYWGSIIALIVARLKGIPFFYWCSYPFPEHDLLAANSKFGFPKHLGRLKGAIRFFLLYKLICPAADHVFVQSNRMLEDMHAYGIPREKMTPVPMGVATRLCDWVAKNEVKVVSSRIVYLGTLAAVRRLDMLLDAFLMVLKSVPDAELYFVGDGDHPSERQALERKCAELGLLDKVQFTGFVPMEDAWKLAASAAVCVSPFYPTKVLASTSPTKLVEYLALGRPVVCNDHPEQSVIIQESGAGLCVEWSSKAFALAISELMMDPVKAETMAARGPDWVLANRTYSKIASKLWIKYSKLLKVQS